MKLQTAHCCNISVTAEIPVLHFTECSLQDFEERSKYFENLLLALSCMSVRSHGIKSATNWRNFMKFNPKSVEKIQDLVKSDKCLVIKMTNCIHFDQISLSSV